MSDKYENIDPKIAQRIELLNLQNQLNAIEALVEIFLGHLGPYGDGQPPAPDETALLALHNEATQFLLSDSGQYRTAEVVVRDGNGNIVYTAPDAHQVLTLMRFFFRELQAFWPQTNGLRAAAYTLWRINWIHPFANGNGRTARAFAYTCLCVKAKMMLPGQKIIIDTIRNDPGYYAKYLDALRDADRDTNKPNLDPMCQLLDQLAGIQRKSRYVQDPQKSIAIPK